MRSKFKIRGFLSAAVVLYLALGGMGKARGGEGGILCVGDSLTYGIGGDGVSYPGELEKLTKRKVVTLGLPGWIPRHIVYMYFLTECPALTAEQLKEIPPKEYEDRVNQPKINNLREFYKDGQCVVVAEGGGFSEYRWDGNSSGTGDAYLKPNAVGDPNHHPSIPSGRWVKGRSVEAPNVSNFGDCIIWLGANGMEKRDVQDSLEKLTKDLIKKGTKFTILGLVNRLPTSAPEAELSSWAQWIGECNNVVSENYKDHYIDLQSYFCGDASLGSSLFDVKNWIPDASESQIAKDVAARKAKVIPDSLRNPGNSSHFNALGYQVIASVVAKEMLKQDSL